MSNSDVKQQSRSFRSMEIPKPERERARRRTSGDALFPRGNELSVLSSRHWVVRGAFEEVL